MRWRTRVVLTGLALGFVATAVSGAGAVPSPKDVLGMDVGKDRVLVNYGEAVRYFEALAGASERVRLERFGASVEGRPMLAVAISTSDNLARIEELKAAWRSLADPRTQAKEERDRLFRVTPSCALITAGIHGNEVAGPQAALLFAYRLAAAPAGSVETRWLEHTVVLLVPSLNPDGQELIGNWYRRWLGTRYEGNPYPGLYHRNAGHDNNRDFVFLTQPESRALNHLAYREWRPQLFLDVHQMGMTGPRQFVPPFADPIAPNVNPLIWRVTSNLGTHIALRLEEQGRAGVVSGWNFDANWIGGTRNTGWWKNVFGILTETAGTALGTPVLVDENELRAGGKGLTDYRPQVNFPNPWRGGRWGLPDTVGYVLDIMEAITEYAALYREDVLRGVSTMAGDAIARGERGDPKAWLVRLDGVDPGRARRLANLLIEGGAEAFVAPRGVTADGLEYPAGTVVFPAAQPLRQFVAELMQRQHYPEITPAPNTEILLPYDITAWTLPLMFGVDVVSVTDSLKGELRAAPERLPVVPQNRSSRAGPIAVSASEVASISVALRALAKNIPVSRLAEPLEQGGVKLGAGALVFASGHNEVGALVEEAGVRSVACPGVPSTVRPLRPVTVGIYLPDSGLEDAGWCRFVLEQAGFSVKTVNDKAVSTGPLVGQLDVLVLPPLDGKSLVEGPRGGGQGQSQIPSPPDFRKGIGKDGVEQIRRFFAAGGTVIGFGPSADWLAEVLELPVSNTLKGAARTEFYSPGALLSLTVESGSPLGWGISTRVAAMIEFPSALQTRPAFGEVQRNVAARFADEPLLLSGWIRGEEKLRRRAAVVEASVGPGRAVLFSFAPYFRGQTLATLPLLFNAIGLEMMDPPLTGAAPVPARAR